MVAHEHENGVVQVPRVFQVLDPPQHVLVRDPDVVDGVVGQLAVESKEELGLVLVTVEDVLHVVEHEHVPGSASQAVLLGVLEVGGGGQVVRSHVVVRGLFLEAVQSVGVGAWGWKNFEMIGEECNETCLKYKNMKIASLLDLLVVFWIVT